MSATRTWSEDWQVYMSRVNGEPGAIRVDLGLGPVVPLADKTHLLWVWVYFQSPREDGLSNSEESPQLYAIEDELVPEVERWCRAVLAGCITTQGRREFYFYGETADRFEDSVTRAMQGFPEYRFELNRQLDTDWTEYLNLLYPTPD